MHIITLPLIDSTNSYAQRLLEQGKAEDRMVVLALEQSSGKGQRGKVWDSFPGMGLYTSIILRPPALFALQQFLLNKVIAVGLADYIQSKITQEVKIKWPNDIIIDNAKISGLLIENSLRGNQITAIIAGIGINLNQEVFAGQFETKPVSLKHLTQETYDPVVEVKALYENINAAYEMYLSGQYGLLDKEYQQRLFKRGAPALFRNIADEIFEAELIGVDNNGAAIISRGGNRISVTHPEIRMIMQ